MSALLCATGACSSSNGTLNDASPSLATGFSDLIAPYVGAWVNDNTATGGIKRILIDHAANVHAFGACAVEECDWDVRIAELTGRDLKVTFVFPPDQANRRAPTESLKLRMVGDRLRVFLKEADVEEVFHKAGPEYAIPTALPVGAPTPSS